MDNVSEKRMKAPLREILKGTDRPQPDPDKTPFPEKSEKISVRRIVKVRLFLDGALGVYDGEGNIVQEIPLINPETKSPIVISTMDEEGFNKALQELLHMKSLYQKALKKESSNGHLSTKKPNKT